MRHGEVGLRPLRYRDASTWRSLRIDNEAWLRPWEPSSTVRWSERHSRSAFVSMLFRLHSQAREGSVLPYGVTYSGRLVGQVTVSNIIRGVLRSGHIGYWVDESVAGRGIITTAVALVVDHCFRAVGLHRVQIDIRPENVRSLRVVQKLGLRQEARFSRYLDIDGAYRDHLGFAVTAEEFPTGLVARLPPPR